MSYNKLISLLHGVRTLEPESSSIEPARSSVTLPELFIFNATNSAINSCHLSSIINQLVNSTLHVTKFGSLIDSLSDIMGKNRPVFDADSEDHRKAFKFFLANFRDFCIMEDYVNPA